VRAVYLDTHVVVWLAAGKLERISPAARALLETAPLLISPMVEVELEYLYEGKRLLLRAGDVVRKLEFEIGLTVCPLPFAEVTRLALDESWTRDPFNRMIVAQARAAGLAQLISTDTEIAAHYPRTVW